MFSQMKNFSRGFKLTNVSVASKQLLKLILSKKINRQKISPFFLDFYKYFLDEYGLSIPLYFTLIKVMMSFVLF